MDRRIMLSLAIVASLLNAGFLVNAAEFSVKAGDSDIKVFVSVEAQDQGPKKEKVDPATVERLRKALKEAEEALAKAESRADSLDKIKEYCIGLTEGLLVSGGVIAPLYLIVPSVYKTIKETPGFDIKNCFYNVAIGVSAQASAVLLMQLTSALSYMIRSYVYAEYRKASSAKWDAEREYNKAIQE